MRTSNLIAITADDDEFFRSALNTILTKQLGFSDVIETGSYDEALEQLAAHTDIALGLFDLKMPGMDSAGSLRTVREHFPGTRVAVVSSSKDRKDVLTGLDAGVHGYVPKDLSIAELSRALRMIMEGWVYVPPSITDISSDEDDPSGIWSERPARSVNEAVASLTPRQRQVLMLLVKGNSNKEIARALKLGEGTIKVHMAALYKNLGVNSRAEAAAIGARYL
jgi:DNA-binding NarL/FixJ family response regulator